MVRVAVGDLLISRPPGLILALGLAVAAAGPVRGQGPAGRASQGRIVVIINPDIPARPEGMTAADVRRIFMLRRRFWPDGRRIAPVNLPATDDLRERFSRQFLGQPPRELADYWNDLYFHGVEPPPVVESERAVQLYVARTPGAIGYVEEDALDPAIRVRVVPIRGSS